jgi:sulfur relay (sulfurtransferase) complex TusBCD TusD component (DsrE family)
MGVEELAEGAHRGSLDELANWTRWADKVIAF